MTFDLFFECFFLSVPLVHLSQCIPHLIHASVGSENHFA